MSGDPRDWLSGPLINTVEMNGRRDARLQGEELALSVRVHTLLAMGFGQYLLGEDHDNRFYPNVPFAHTNLLNLLTLGRSAARALNLAAGGPMGRRPRFLDVGCGLGQTLLFAKAHDFDAHGLDRCGKYVEFAKTVVPDPENVYHADALEFDRYDEFPVIFWYNPIRDRDLMKRLERRLADEIPTPGVLLAAFDNGFLSNRNDLFAAHRPDYQGTAFVKCTWADWKRVKDRWKSEGLEVVCHENT